MSLVSRAARTHPNNGQRPARRSRALAAGVSVGLAALAVTPTLASANQVIAFPERDFLSGDGFTAGAIVNYTVTHPGGASFNASVRADLDGLAEINHPGGACWTTMTPDVRAGDARRVRLPVRANVLRGATMRDST